MDIERPIAVGNPWRRGQSELDILASLERHCPMNGSSVVRSDPHILGGTPVFVGTRIPVQALIDRPRLTWRSPCGSEKPLLMTAHAALTSIFWLGNGWSICQKPTWPVPRGGCERLYSRNRMSGSPRAI